MRNRLKLTLICFCLLAVASFAVHPARRASARQAGARKIDFVRDIQPIFQARCAQCHGGEKHWAFVAPVRPPTPEVKNKAWARNPIDAFILARLERENLAPSPEADKITLLRRLSLDLIGLPPTPEEVDAFLKDTSSRAYEKQVERLLASPHYGERWGRLWLDAARYADSDGFEKDKPRSVWFYRDWVINALNQDKPYDQFIIEQVAGDLLPNATQEQRVATGFLRNSMINEEGGVDPEQFRMEAMFDRMDAIGKGVLGLTIQCAQCHNHKFDPLKQEEYYRMFAFLNNSDEGSMAVYTPEEQMKRAGILSGAREIEAKLRELAPDWLARMNAWEESVKNDQPEWKVIQPEVNDISTDGAKYLPQKDGSFLVGGYAPAKHRVKLCWRTDEANIAAFRLELMTDPNLPLGGPGRSYKGSCALTEFEVEDSPAASDEGGPKKAAKLKIVRATADVNPPETEVESKFNDKSGKRRVTGPVDFAIDGKEETGWSIDAGPGLRNRPGKAVFNLEKPLANAGGAVWKQHPEGDSQLVMSERAEARGAFILKRGDFLRPDKRVSPGVPAFLHPLPANAPANRLTFAQWLVDRQSPTTARAFVNRLWQAYFGAGLVATSEDLGKQSEAPSHPELLDWLAVEFMDGATHARGDGAGNPQSAIRNPQWSIKNVHRLIVTSATYRQSSKVTPRLLEKDPQNRLLARAPRLRVEGEIVRDIALAASGLLNPRIGGPSVFPPSPEFLYLPPASFGVKSWREEKGENRYRRALYTFGFRSVPYPMLQAFDAPNGDVSCVRRARSNTPLQALTTLNETLFLEAARALALKTLKEGGATDARRLEFAFRRVLARKPSAGEAAELLGLLGEQRARFAGGESNPWNLATSDPDKPYLLPKGVTMEQVAAWTTVTRVLLNLDEAITKE